MKALVLRGKEVLVAFNSTHDDFPRDNQFDPLSYRGFPRVGIFPLLAAVTPLGGYLLEFYKRNWSISQEILFPFFPLGLFVFLLPRGEYIMHNQYNFSSFPFLSPEVNGYGES